jgi:hypothetical protein
MECFGTTDFDNSSLLITLSAIIISGLHCIYLLTAGGLSPGGSTHLHTNNTQNNTNNNIRTKQIQTNVEECGPCPVFASFTLAFALQLRKKHGKTSVRVRRTSVRLRKTSVRLRRTSVRLRKTSVRLRKTSVMVRRTSVRLRKTSVRLRKTSVKVSKTSVRLSKTSVRLSKTSVTVHKVIEQTLCFR